MAFKQTIWPNLDDDPKNPVYIYVDGKIASSWVGWCLAAVKASYGATKSMGCALNAWNNDPTKHTDYDLPDGLFVPIYWSGDKDGFGHIAIAQRRGNDVTVWSTPTAKQGGATYVKYIGELRSTIDSMTRTYGCKTYLGWTEFVCEKQVICVVQGEKSNEEICQEVWEGKWGVGKEREQRLTEAGYDYATIQRMVDEGVGKPQEPTEEPKPEEPVEEPSEPTEDPQDGSEEPKNEDDSSVPQLPDSDNSSGEQTPDSETNNDETTGSKDEFVPAKSADTKLIGEIIEEAGEDFNPSKTVKLIAYLVGDALLVGSLLVPDIVNVINAPSDNVWAEYMSKILLEAGIAILTVFKLFKRKGK